MATKAEPQEDDCAQLRRRLETQEHVIAMYERLLFDQNQHLNERDQSVATYADYRRSRKAKDAGSAKTARKGKQERAPGRREELCQQWARLAVERLKADNPGADPSTLPLQKKTKAIQDCVEALVQKLDREQPRKKLRSKESHLKEYQAEVRRYIERDDY